jgi:hypothetical protein
VGAKGMKGKRPPKQVVRPNQPDFQALFLGLGESGPRRLSYSARFDSCIRHDLQFLASLVHDARLQRQNVVQRGERISIAIERDCWELGIEPDGDLYVAPAVLRAAPVRRVEWRLLDSIGREPDTELSIVDLYPAEDFYDRELSSFTLVLDGGGWSCRLLLDREEPSVELVDRQKPVLSRLYYAGR